MKSHPLTKLQFIFAILWVVPSMISVSLDGPQQDSWFIISVIPFIALSITTIFIGWIMMVQKQSVLYPPDIFAIRLAGKLRGPQAVDQLKAKYGESRRRVMLSTLNLVSGSLCLLLGIWCLMIMIKKD